MALALADDQPVVEAFYENGANDGFRLNGQLYQVLGIFILEVFFELYQLKLAYEEMFPFIPVLFLAFLCSGSPRL